MGQGMSATISPETFDLKDPRSAKSPLKSVSVPEFANDLDKSHKEQSALVVTNNDIWRMPASVALQIISCSCAMGGVLFQPSNFAASLNGSLSAAVFTASWLPQELAFPVPLVQAASLTATAFAICTPDAPALYTALLALGGTCSLLNLGRVVIHEPQQGKGVVQLALMLPAAAGIRLMAGPGLLPWSPMMMTLGASTFAIGMSMQLTKNQPWIHNGLKTAGCLELVAGLTIPFVNEMLANKIPFMTPYDSMCAMALVGVLVQAAFSVPAMCGAEEPKDLDVFHHVMTRVNFIMTAMALTTGFALRYGWSGAPTVACALVSGSSGSLLMTSAWDYMGAAELSL